MMEYIVPAVATIVVAVIEAMAARDRRRSKKLRQAEEQRQRGQEELVVQLIQGSWAAIALGEATARAIQRIPDAHCNGDMHAALEYAVEIKHQQKEFLARKGIHAVLD